MNKVLGHIEKSTTTATTTTTTTKNNNNEQKQANETDINKEIPFIRLSL